MGSAYFPGAYSVSSLASITNVLHVSGGVSEIGSVRNIQLKRQGKIVTTFDLYDLLLNGDISKDIRVQNGDVIFIPTIHKSVRMHGAFKRPALFELKEGESIQDLIGFAGGVASESKPNSAELNRVNKSLGSREITKLDLTTPENNSITMADGDMVFIPAIKALDQASITLTGQFKYPGKYSVKNGDKLSSLLNRAGGFTDNAFVYGAVFNRRSVSEMQDASFRRAADDMETAIAGAVIGGQLNGGVGPSVSDLLRRLRTTRSPGRLIVDIDPINIKTNPEKDIYLEDGDIIHIPSRINAVTVVGDVYSPGTIPFKNQSSMKDYIMQAGGLRPSADNKEIFMILPNGEARAIKSGIWRFKRQFISPGSTIFIPRDTKPFDWLIATGTITPILSNLATTVAALAAIND
jgi:protein involved in polysaccharide export with SLBB domain